MNGRKWKIETERERERERECKGERDRERDNFEKKRGVISKYQCSEYILYNSILINLLIYLGALTI